MRKLFKKIDVNKDKQIVPDELQTFFTRMDNVGDVGKQ
jgi:hypothetical protein